MKKGIFIGVAILVFLLLALFAAFFTPYGSNALLKPLANKIIAQKLPKPKVEITKLDSTINSLKIAGKVAKSIDFSAFGDVNYLKKAFNLRYDVKANEVVFENKVLPLHLNIKGQAVGNIDKFGVNGAGSAFESDIDYRFVVDKKQLKSINAHLNAAQFAQIFQMASITPLADGLLFVNIQMPSLDIKHPKGFAKIAIKDGRLNRAAIAKEFKIVLPKDEKFTLLLKSAVQKRVIVAKGDVNATSVKLHLSKLLSSLDFSKVKGYFSLFVPNLSRLEPLAKIKLKGKIKAKGAFYLNRKKNFYEALIETQSFGGVAKVKASSRKIKAILKEVSIPKILYTLNQPYYVPKGSVSGKIEIRNPKKAKGSFVLSSSGVLNRKLFKIKLPSYKYSLYTKGVVNDSRVFAKKTILKSALFKAILHDSKYSLLSKTLQTPFSVEIANLRALYFLTKMPLRGRLRVDGFLKQKGSIIDLKANSSSFGGKLSIVLSGKRAKVIFKNLSLVKLLYTLNQPPLLYKGFTSGTFNLNSLAPLNGFGNIALNGIINEKTLQKVYKISLPKGVKFQAQSKDIVIKNNKVKLNAKIVSNLATLTLQNLQYNLLNKTLSSKYLLDIPNLASLKPLTKQELKGSVQVKGSLRQSGNSLFVSGISDIARGTVEFNLKNNRFLLNGAGLSIVEVLEMLNKPKVLDGVAKVALEYNIKNKQGKFRVDINEARFLNSKLVVMLKQYANFDLAQEIFHEGTIDGVIDNNIITFNVNTNSKRVKIIVHNGQIDTKAQTIYAKVDVNYKGKDYKFIVKGPLENPHYKISFSGAIKEKVMDKLLHSKKIQKLIPKELLKLKEKESNTSQKVDVKHKLEEKVHKKIEKVVPNEVKGLFKGLFH